MNPVNQLSKGPVYAGDVLVADGQLVHSVVAQINRTDGTAKVIGRLPAGASIVDIAVINPTVSDAATTAVVDVGFQDGTGKELVNDNDVKTATGITAGVLSAFGTPLAAAHTIVGKYAETGTASAHGGPYTVRILFVTNVSLKFA